jgi:hypothetical protein
MHKLKWLFVAAGLLPGDLTAAADRSDWLIDNAPFKAQVIPDPNGKSITLDNGLVRRVFRLAPNAATVSFENLMTGEEFMRAVRPEALISVDGVNYEVGGLSGQPVQNFLKPGWIDQLEPNPDSFQFTGYRTGKAEARFPWLKRREWMPVDMPWPPPGVSLTLEFQAPATFGGASLKRELLITDDFTELAPDWKLFLSHANPRTSFRNEGKVGEIMACENTHAFGERPWPADGEVVELQCDPGTDKSATWGPGLGLVFEGGQVVRFYLRPGKGKFGLLSRDGDMEVGQLQDGQAYLLRVTLRGGRAVCDASTNGKSWERIGEVAVTGKPVAVRVGKLGGNGGTADYSEPGNLERCKLMAFRIHGPALEESRAKSSAPSVAGKVNVEVHYELFDGIPLVSKWVVVRNGTRATVRLDTFVCELLALTEAESVVGSSPSWQLPKLHVETDYSFGGAMGTLDTLPSVHWMKDPTYTSQVSYDLQTPCLLQCRPPIGPDQEIAAGTSFESFRTFELAYDTTERERKGLARRRMYRTIAPWVTENPVLMHVRSAKPEAVKLAIDQCAETGFEMVILTFGSGFDYESRDPKYQAGLKELADYARSKHIALGGYSLCSSRGAGTAADNVVGTPTFGVAPCLGSQWGHDYLEQLRQMMENTGLSVLEHDGSYPGDTCAATNHPYHQGKEDSQWVQWKAITDLYKWCRARGAYLNVPDWYYLSGSSKCGMGYREVNWSLPREYQEIIERQNIFDGTWEKTPSMGWMFVPLTEYQGGGAAATIEPLHEHLAHYEQRLANLFGAGVIACYRGPRLYDTDETKAVVKRWVDFYKKHRAVLNADLLHLRRADGRDLDYILHVNPAGREKGLLLIYNPLEKEVSRTLRIPLYYTGKTSTASVSERDGPARSFKLDREYNIEMAVRVPARGVTWFVVQ